MLKITRDHVIYEMSKDNEPVLSCESGATVLFETHDCFSGDVQSETDTVSQINFDHVNPATGPLFVEGAEPGDTLKVSINRIKLNTQGAVVTAPGLGALAGQVEKEETIIGQVNENGDVVYRQWTIPGRKMIGVIGTAPAGEAVNTGTPYDHGGNMDSTLITEGATVYLPVEVEGALLAMGDMHAVMGDGEIMGSGLEIAGEIEVTVEVLKDCHLPLPLVENEDVIATIASRETIEEASQLAIEQMADYLTHEHGMTLNEAGMFLSLAGNLIACQIVNPNKTMRVEVSKAVLNSRKS